MEISKEISQKIQELQMFEQQLQSFLAQKQTIQLDSNETLNALDELKRTKDEVFKTLSGIMIKSDKDELIKELEEKNKLLELRIDSLEKQEKIMEERALKLRDEITSSMKEKKE